MSTDVIKEENKKRVSFSQYSMWMKCPYSWKLNYLEGKRVYDGSINTCFGTAMHEAIQSYLKALYTESVEKAESIDLYKHFKSSFDEELTKEKSKNSKFTYTDDEYNEFVFDGEDILRTFTSPKNRIKYFPSQKYELIGIELPIELPIRTNLEFIAYVDIVLKAKDTNKYKILDFKTSYNGWNKHMIADPVKYEQILLYKAFYSKKFEVPLDQIDVEFFILKRKLYENVSFPQSRIQIFEPKHTKQSIIESINGFTQFINECFTTEGNYNINAVYPKIPGKNKKNCTYCAHHKVLCDGKADKLK